MSASQTATYRGAGNSDSLDRVRSAIEIALPLIELERLL